MSRPRSIAKIYPIINLLILILYYKCLIFFAQILVKVKIHCLIEKRELYFFLDGGSIELVVKTRIIFFLDGGSIELVVFLQVQAR